MKASNVLFLAVLCVVAVEGVHAQRSRNVTKSRYQYAPPKVRGNKAKIICPVFDKGQYPYHSFGFKLGDPFALTYKYYPNKRLSFAADAGKPASGLYNRYYAEKFSTYLRNDTLPSTESGVAYVTHRVISDMVAELKVLYHIDVNSISQGLQGYAGLGWELRRTELGYDYEYIDGNGPDGDPFGEFRRHRLAMGPQVVAGIEYAYFTIPVSAFMEVEFFTDLQADPGWQRFEGGVGLRYVF